MAERSAEIAELRHGRRRIGVLEIADAATAEAHLEDSSSDINATSL